MPDRRASLGWPTLDDRVAGLLRELADGRPPPSDGRTEVLPQPPGPVAGVLAFDGHHVVAADIDPDWVRAMCPDGDLSAPLQPAFLGAAADRLGRTWDNLDAVFLGVGEEGDVLAPLAPADPDPAHPRVARSLQFRTDATVYEVDDAAVLIVARGLARRWEAAFEVHPAHRGQGLGRALVRSALRLVPIGEPVFVQVAPGNVSSTRAVLAAGGFRPIGAEVLFAR